MLTVHHLGVSQSERIVWLCEELAVPTMRVFAPRDICGYPNVLAYLQRIGARPAYKQAMQKCDPQLTPLLT
jgi:hypothetical protein